MNGAYSRVVGTVRTQLLVVVGLGFVIGTIALIVVLRRDDDSSRAAPPTQAVIPVFQDGYGFDRPPSPGLVRYARKIYQANWEACQQPWSVLLADAGESRARPFSRSALQEIAPQLPYYPRAITFDGFLLSIANKGCIEGFLDLLERDRDHALS